MPVGPYETFGECLAAQQKKGKSKDSASKICGEMEKRTQQKQEGSLCSNAMQMLQTKVNDLKDKGFNPNIMYNPQLAEEERLKYEVYNSQKENEDRFFIKSFLFSAAINLNDWGVTLDSLKKYIYTFKDKPIVLTDDFSHPDNGKKYDTIENTLNYQEDFRVGNIVDIIYKDNIYYAIAEITDEKAKKLFRENKLPMFVSPAIAFTENTIRKNNWTGLHLAIVDRPAFTVAKATINGVCEGSYNLCTAQLGTASIQKEYTNEGEKSINQFNLDYVLDQYKQNVNQIVKHNIISFKNDNEQILINKMVDNTTQQVNNNANTELKQPSTVQQEKNYDLNTCVAQFLERGLDANTAREICTVALGAGGQEGGSPNAAQGGEPSASGGFNVKETMNYVASKIRTYEDKVNVLNTTIRNYEDNLRNLGVEPKNAIDFFKEQAKKIEEERNLKRYKEFEEFLSKYHVVKDNKDLENEINTYVKFNVPMEHVTSIYEGKKTLEELEKEKQQEQPKQEEGEEPSKEIEKQENKEVKAHELFNQKKENELANIDTSKVTQKATAKQANDEKFNAYSVLLDRFAPINTDENSSNNINGGN